MKKYKIVLMNCFSRVSGIIIFCMLKVIYETTNNKNQIHRFTALIHIVIFKNIFFPQQASEASSKQYLQRFQLPLLTHW